MHNESLFSGYATASEVIAKPNKWIIVMCDYNPFTHRQYKKDSF